ncbi:unnamed protein product, partial [Prorocentrum cordatum]
FRSGRAPRSRRRLGRCPIPAGRPAAGPRTARCRDLSSAAWSGKEDQRREQSVERRGGGGGGDLPIGPTRRGAHRLPGQLAPRGGGAAAAAAARLAHGRGVPPRGLNRRPHSSGTGY